jgi:hypothetical protein
MHEDFWRVPRLPYEIQKRVIELALAPPELPSRLNARDPIGLATGIALCSFSGGVPWGDAHFALDLMTVCKSWKVCYSQRDLKIIEEG